MTIYDNATIQQKAKSFELWGDENWDGLYDFFVKNKLNLDSKTGKPWPPFNGFIKIEKVLKGNEIISYGVYFDRFQSNKVLSGSFASPVYKGEYNKIDMPFTYDSRALLDDIKEGTYYKVQDKRPQRSGI